MKMTKKLVVREQIQEKKRAESDILVFKFLIS